MSALFLLTLAAAQGQAPAITGYWTNPKNTVTICIAACGEALCGKVLWASPEAQADARKGAPQLIGADLLTGLKAKSDTQWTGRLFLPDRNMRVKAKLTILSPAEIEVSGCALGKAVCKSQVWTRTETVPDDN